MSTELATRQDRQPQIIKLLALPSTEEKLALVCPPGVDPKELLCVARAMIAEKPELTECTPESVLLAIQKAMVCGLPLDGRHGHLVPFNKKSGSGWIKECKFIADWKGYVALGRRCGLTHVHPDVVCHGDNYRHWTDDNGSHVIHEFDHRKPRGQVVGAYCQTLNAAGVMDVEYMHREEIEAIQKRSKERSFSPWVSDWNEMGKKTVIRRMSKRWDIDTRYRAALADDEERFPEAKKVDLVMPDEVRPALTGEPKKANLVEANAEVVPADQDGGEHEWEGAPSKEKF